MEIEAAMDIMFYNYKAVICDGEVYQIKYGHWI